MVKPAPRTIVPIVSALTGLCRGVYINGKKACVAGVGEMGVLSAHLTWVKRERHEADKFQATILSMPFSPYNVCYEIAVRGIVVTFVDDNWPGPYFSALESDEQTLAKLADELKRELRAVEIAPTPVPVARDEPGDGQEGESSHPGV